MTSHRASEAIALTITGLGYELVEVERGAGGLLRVTIDHPPGPVERFVNVDDCEKVTRQLQHVLEVEGASYERLEVSSPGLDRLLRSEADLARFAGEEVELTLKEPFQGRKRFKGELRAAESGWRLLLSDKPAVKTAAKAAGTAARTTGHAPSKTSLKKLARLSAADAAAAETVRTLDFSLAEVREARLVPVVDFKGRRFASPGSVPAGSASHQETEGGFVQ